MIKNRIYETKENIQNEYKKLKKKKVKALPIWLLIIAIILGWYFYVSDVQAEQKGLETQLEKLERTFEQNFQNLEKKNHDQDNKIENIKEAKAKQKAEEARLAALKQSVARKPVYVQRVSGNCEQYRPLIAQYAWNVDTMVAICNAESGGVPTKANWTDSHATCKGSFGLFQISCDRGILYDPTANIAAAWSKYIGAKNNPKTGYWGYWPWSVCKNGRVTCI